MTRNPFEFPSTLTRNLSPFSSKFPLTEVISETISLKLFFICLAIIIFSIPNNKLIADDAKTGSFASTNITSPSRLMDLNC